MSRQRLVLLLAFGLAAPLAIGLCFGFLADDLGNGYTPLPQPDGDGVAFVLNDVLYHAGGWAGNPSTPLDRLDRAPLSAYIPGSWQEGTLSPARYGAAGVVHNGRFYLLGGYDGNQILRRVDSYDGNGWRQERDLPQALNFPAAAVEGNYLYVAGGLPGPTDQVWLAKIQDDGRLEGWQRAAPLKEKLTTRLAVWGTCLYVVGGRGDGGNCHAEVYLALWGSEGMITDWQAERSLPEPLALHSVAVRGNVLYVAGGELPGGGYSDKVYQATIGPDCTLSAWSTASSLPAARQRMAVASTDRGIYLLGGRGPDGQFVNTVWYDVLAAPTPTPTPTRTPYILIHKHNDPFGEVRPGDTISYTIYYANAGDMLLTGVLIIDTVPAHTELVMDSISGEYTVSDRVITWNIDDLAVGGNGRVSFSVRVLGPATPTATPTPTYSPNVTPTPTNTPIPAPTQWALSATASSAYGYGPGTDPWTAWQATGPPNVAGCGDLPNAWAPLSDGTAPEWLLLTYAEAANATGVAIHETNIGGFVTQIDYLEPDGTSHTVWSGSDTTACGDWLTLSHDPTSYPVKQVRVHTAIAGWEEVDAVRLDGAAGPTDTPTATLTSTFTPTPMPVEIRNVAHAYSEQTDWKQSNVAMNPSLRSVFTGP